MTPRHLLLVRHAQAAWEHGVQTDFDRTLTATGRRDAEELARWLRAHAACPDAIVASPAPRALATAELLAAAWPAAPTIVTEPDFYEAPLERPVGIMTRFDDAWRTVIVVGHNPSLSHCADWLIGEPTVLELPAGGLVWLELDAEHWRDLGPGCARVRELRVPGAVAA